VTEVREYCVGARLVRVCSVCSVCCACLQMCVFTEVLVHRC
jgi:hypothetical protein